MKPTKQQILDCNDIEQLERWVAEVCMGYKKSWTSTELAKFTDEHFDKNGKLVIYAPCHDTDLVRSQCWQLAEKYNVFPLQRLGDRKYWEFYIKPAGRSALFVQHRSAQIVVAKTVLLLEIGDE